MSTSLGRTLTPIVAATVVGVGQTYTVIPLLPEMADSFGVPTGAVAWMATAFSLAYAAGFLLAGPAADRYGPRRVLLAGLVPTALATVAVALAGCLAAGIVLRVVQGLAASTVAPTAFAYIADHVDRRRRPLALTVVVGAGLAAAVVMQVVAQLLEPFGWRSVFVASGAGLLLIAAAGVRLLRPDAGERAGSMLAALAALPRLLVRRRLLMSYGAASTLLGAFVVLYTGLELAGPESLDSDGALLALRASALPAIVAAPLLAVPLARYRARTRLVGALLVSAAGALFAVPAAGDVVTLAVALLLFVGGIAVGAPALIEIVQGEAAGSVGAATALYTCSLFVGTSVGAPVAAWLAASGFAATAAVAAGIVGCGALLASGA